MKYILSLIIVFILGILYLNLDSVNNMDLGITSSNLTELPDHAVGELKPTEIVELSDGDIYEMEATIVSQEVGNRTVKRLAYNGQIPGPVLKVQKGSSVTIKFTNNIDMETALHSHGLRGDWKMDGAVPLTPAIPVGGSFEYVLEFPDTGVYWYHPHVREDYQQEMGLYGNFIVEEEGYWNDVNQEEYIIVDDILEDGDFSEGVVTNTLMGRFGDTLLINDKEDYNLTVNQGEITRAFITNVANTRTFELEFTGSETKLVGGDIGRIENEVIIEHQIIAPSERYIVEIYYDSPGTYNIDHRGESIGTVTVLPATIDRKDEFMLLRSNADDYVEIRSDIVSLSNAKVDKNLRLDIEMKGMMSNMNDEMNENGMVNLMGIEMDRAGAIEHCQMMPNMSGCEPYLEDEMLNMMGEEDHGKEGIEWEDDMAMMNNMSNNKNIEWYIEDSDTGDRNNDIEWSFKQGDQVKVRVYNDEKGVHPMQHPIHFHGQRFIVLSRDGEVNDNLQWKDTVLIPRGQTVDLLIDMSNPGNWMAHCHIAEHLHSGMMFNFEVK